MSGLFCRAVARGESFPLHCRPALHGGEPAAPGERIPTESARSVEGSKRHRGRLEAHCPESSFSRLAPGRVGEQGWFHLCRLSRLALETEGEAEAGTMPTDRVDDPQVVPWLEKDDLAYYGPFRCVSAPRAPRGGRTRATSTRRPPPRFSRAKAGVGERIDSTPSSAPSRRARVQHAATRERAPLRRAPLRTPFPRTPRPERRRRASSARLASLADANPLLRLASSTRARQGQRACVPENGNRARRLLRRERRARAHGDAG